MPSLIDTCNEETFRDRPGLTRPGLRRGLSGAQVTRRPGPEAPRRPRHHAPSQAHRPGRRAGWVAAARRPRRAGRAGEQPGDPKPCTQTGPLPGYLLSFNTSTRSAQFSHIVRPPPPPPPLRIALTDPDRRGGGDRGRGGGRPAGGAGKRRGRAAARTGRGAAGGGGGRRARERERAGARRRVREVQASGAPRPRRRGKGEGRGREEGGVGGERSSRVTSPPTRRRGHRRRRRRHFNGALGLRSALSAQAKEPKRGASRSHSSALPALPALRLSPHTRRTPCRSRWPPSLSSSVQPPRPRSTHCTRSPTPPSPDLCQRPEGKRAARCRGGSRVSGRWRRLRAGRGYAASPAPVGFELRGGSASAEMGGPPSPLPQRVAPLVSRCPEGKRWTLPSFGYFEGGDSRGSADPGTRLAPHLAS